MKKRLLFYILASVFLLHTCSVTVFAEGSKPSFCTSFSYPWIQDPLITSSDMPITRDGFSYAIQKDGTVAIMKYTGGKSEVVIPSRINGRTVSAIGNNAFTKENLTAPLTSVTIPDTVVSIYNYAFAFNDTLTEIHIPNSVSWIGSSVFTGCGLESIHLPSHLTILNEYVFMDCHRLKSITIPEKVRSISRSAFANCNQLKKLCIPYGVESIDENAFAQCTSLADVMLPESVSFIGKSSFYNCARDLVLHVPYNSYALEYAKEQKLRSRTYLPEPFQDVSSSDWFYRYVIWANMEELMTGYSNGTFGPADSLTRGQFALILYRYEGSPSVLGASPFPDVKKDAYYTDAVIWAKRNGIINGYENGNFGPNDRMNREQLATMMYRYAKKKGFDTTATSDLSAFPDASDVNAFAKDAMKWAIKCHIIAGDQKRLNPQGLANRAVTATIMYRFVNEYL